MSFTYRETDTALTVEKALYNGVGGEISRIVFSPEEARFLVMHAQSFISRAEKARQKAKEDRIAELEANINRDSHELASLLTEKEDGARPAPRLSIVNEMQIPEHLMPPPVTVRPEGAWS